MKSMFQIRKSGILILKTADLECSVSLLRTSQSSCLLLANNINKNNWCTSKFQVAQADALLFKLPSLNCNFYLHRRIPKSVNSSLVKGKVGLRASSKTFWTDIIIFGNTRLHKSATHLIFRIAIL